MIARIRNDGKAEGEILVILSGFTVAGSLSKSSTVVMLTRKKYIRMKEVIPANQLN
jgi:hypothetical protein